MSVMDALHAAVAQLQHDVRALRSDVDELHGTIVNLRSDKTDRAETGTKTTPSTTGSTTSRATKTST